MKKVLIVILTIVILIFLCTTYFLFSKKIRVVDKTYESQVVKTNYKNPIIPEGFHTVETENASWKLDENGNIKGWNNGLVIEDDNGNQFVWVPCTIDESNEVPLYGRYYTIKGMEPTLVNEEQIHHVGAYYYYENDDINNQIKKMIENYGGFYIARYETGINNGQYFTKKNCEVLNNINASEAVEISKTIINKESIYTYLMTSYCFDTTIKWLEMSNKEFSETPHKFCNFLNENKELTKTGFNEDYKINNIYDIIGNAAEFTTERYHETYAGDVYVYRGGEFNQGEENAIINFAKLYGMRGTFDGSSRILGSRVVLIIK